MKSKLLIHITKEIEIGERTMQIEEFITDLFVYTKQKDNDIFYRKDSDTMYTINESSRNVIPISLDQRIQQAHQFKNMFSQLDLRKEEKEESRKVIIEGKGDMVVMSGEVKISKFPALQNTANLDAYMLLSKTATIDIDIHNNEITDYINIDINIQGQRLKNKIVVKNIEVLEQNINRYDYLLDYSVN